MQTAHEVFSSEIAAARPPAGVRTARQGLGVTPLVLVAESDPHVRTHLRAVMSDQRMRVVQAETGIEALSQAATHNPDMIVLDFGLPDMTGIQVTTRLREWTEAPILILSSREAECERVPALDSGANEYLTRPFGTGELLARMRVWLRHRQRADSTTLRAELEVGALRINFSKFTAAVGGREVRLTPKQYALFAMMMRNAGRVLTHQQIIVAVWGPAYTAERQYLRVYMRQLRQKFERDPSRPQYFLTKQGLGYCLAKGSTTSGPGS
jgi:two-component system KDP operon response regulator KdpE